MSTRIFAIISLYLIVLLLGLGFSLSGIHNEWHTLGYDWVSIWINTAQITLILVGIYQLGIAVGGLFPTKSNIRDTERYYPRFLLLTAAHNERDVIAENVKNLLALDYPKDRFDVVVIADNCTDDTAEVARAAGAIVWERFNPVERGKGYALCWAIHEKANLDEYDAVCVFDADNLCDLNFLQVMRKEILAGRRVIQAYLDTKNPWDSWVSASYAASYWFMNRFWQRARMRLGLSGALGGTGFCIATEYLKTHPWEAKSLTEDLEYSVRVVLAGDRVFWTGKTKVYDEKPVELAATFPQRTRWLKGHWSTAFAYSVSLWRMFLRTGRWTCIDFLLYLWQPMVILLTGFNLLISVLQWTVGNTFYVDVIARVLPASVWNALMLCGVFLPLLAYVLEHAPWKSFVYFPSFLFFNLTWIPVTIRGLLFHRDRSWHHTKHTRSVSIEQLARVIRSGDA